MLTVLPSLAIIGAGRVGSALARAAHQAGYMLVGVASRQPEHAAVLAASVNTSPQAPIDLLHTADVVFLTVPDDALSHIALELAHIQPSKPHQAIVHCSGALSSSVLAPLADRGWITGSFHPLQAFATTSVEIQPGITWAIEAPDPLRDMLLRLAHNLGGVALELAPEHKVLYHAAAVIASNFAITLAARAVDVLGMCGMTADAGLNALLPLLQGNLANLAHVGLPHALTGPLARGDWGTIERHLAALDHAAPDVAGLYRACVEATLPLIAATQPTTKHLS